MIALFLQAFLENFDFAVFQHCCSQNLQLKAVRTALSLASLRNGMKYPGIANQLSHVELLEKIGLATTDSEHSRIKVGAFVLFGKARNDTLLQRDFTFLRYQSDGKLFVYREDIRLPAQRMVERLLELIRPFNQRGVSIEGLKRKEFHVYPEEAIREAILNALGHRDYYLTGLRNECRLYPDRIEFISAGSLPSIISLETLGSRHYSRNPKIMQALMEENGQGINLMRESLVRNNNPAPEFTCDGTTVKVTFWAPSDALASKKFSFADLESCSSDELRHYFLERLEDPQQSFTRKNLETILELGSTQAKGLIRRMLDLGLIRKLSAGPATKYEVIE